MLKHKRWLSAVMVGAIMAIACTGFAVASDLPDKTITPGVVNPAVTPQNIDKTICVSGWTKTIRPAASYTNKLKQKQMADMHLTGSPHDYEEDHLISLEIGGNPTDPKNLWPQAWEGQWGAHKKDQLENQLKKLVCAGKLPLAQAQSEISSDWIAAYQKYEVPK